MRAWNALAKRGTLQSVVLLFLTACTSAPPPLRVPDMRETTKWLVWQAPLIVLATVQEVRPEAAQYLVTFRGARTRLRLMRTTLAVEQVLKGPLAKDNTIDFYFYLWPEGQFPNQINPFPPVHGDRAIFFLENEQGLIRSMTDMHSPHIQINSGASPSGVVAHDGRDMAIHNEIVRLLFTPGDSLNEESFSRSISGAFSVAIDLVGFANTLPLLKTLITHNSQVVRAAACFELAGNVPGQCSCLGRFIDVKSLPAYLRNPNVIQETCKPDEWLKNQLALTMTRGSI